MDSGAGHADAGRAKAPKTKRGERTLRALLDAASEEFGERGFHDASIGRITARAGVATGTFYTWFDSKEAVFTALVRDLSARVRDHVGPIVAAADAGIATECAAQAGFIEFVRRHKEIYRVIDEAEFVDPASWRAHYANTAARIATRLDNAVAEGRIAPGDAEVRAWAIMGMNVFLGLRFGVWDEGRPLAEIGAAAGDLLTHGLTPRDA